MPEVNYLSELILDIKDVKDKFGLMAYVSAYGGFRKSCPRFTLFPLLHPQAGLTCAEHQWF